MSRKVYYKYNPATEEYERVYPSMAKRIWTVVARTLEIVAITAALCVLIYIYFDLPKERVLILENDKLRQEVGDLDARLNEAITVMDDLAERDNNFYRVILQMDPLTPSQRFAGLEAVPAVDTLPGSSKRQQINSLSHKLKLFERQLAAQTLSYDEVTRAIGQNADRIAHIPSIHPISEKDMTSMASGYGYRIDPIYGTKKHHDGMDFASPIGTAVYATGDGKVIEAGEHGTYGNLIIIDNGYNYTTRFAHLSEILVKEGQEVKRGELIGKVGSTGKSTGPHLHYEVRIKGEPQNPVNYYFQDQTPEEYAEMIHLAENAGHVMD